MEYIKKSFSFDIKGYRFTFKSVKYATYHVGIQEHFHAKNGFELNYNIEGYSKLISNGEQYLIEPDTFFINGSGNRHAQLPVSDDTVTDYCIFFYIEWKEESKKKDLYLEDFSNLSFFISKGDTKLLALLDEIKEELINPQIESSEYLEAICRQFILRLLRLYHPVEMVEIENEFISSDARRLQRIEAAFLWQIENLSLNSLSEIIHCGPRQTQRILQQEYGKSFRELKAYYAVSKAKELLLNTDQSIEEIATLCGCTAARQLNDYFQNEYHISPSKYRMENRKV
ncbi:MAG: AraC family transcriptional regulator [Lachnospiraceae bacterium]